MSKKPEREDFTAPAVMEESPCYTTTTLAIRNELIRGGDAFKIARYFDVDIRVVKIIQKSLARQEQDGNQSTEKDR